MTAADVFLGFLALLFPPLPVWVKCGICSADSLINILLCVLGYLPGLLHAWYIIAKYPEPPYEYEPLHGERDSNRVAHVYVQVPHAQQQQQQQQGGHKGASNNMSYGTQNNNNAGRAAAPPPQQSGVTNAGEGSSDHQGVPPSYADVVAGDNKVQSHD
ncbi:hypothetical protein S40285_02887 [Stachybotrys chlorohalonatus IBT 40285]|uniref:Stress response RCI peptide n=1 Tax=Stachybotrys chlorohalonatus (strain IBT 40285) TaxID=1283841 RepID=A0A084QLS7_STAC4|nr:hypothetical protein S40285_02887 [Stachybotrys chlorohalonata IBT 40285]